MTGESLDIDEARFAAQERRDRMDFFAGHAPAEIPVWFRAIYENSLAVPERPNIPYLAGDDGDFIRKRCEDWQRDPCYDIDQPITDDPLPGHIRDALLAYSRLMGEYWRLQEQHSRLSQSGLYFAWRVYYASAMIEELDKVIPED